MGGGGEAVGQVAQVVLDLAERLLFREIDEAFSHLPQSGLRLGTQLLQQGFNGSTAS